MSVVMKVLERLVQRFLKSVTRDLLGPLQFAYRENRSVDDAVSLALFFILRHLDCPNGYARILFLDFSSAFNTIVPQKLFEKLQYLSVPLSLCHWILDFLVVSQAQQPPVVNHRSEHRCPDASCHPFCTRSLPTTAVSYTHLTLPTRRTV